MKKLLLALSLVLAISISCVAGPNYDELKSFRVLVPDYSKTSGGLSPAISPSGDDLAYYSADNSHMNTGDVYRLGGCISLLGMEGTTINPKKLEYEPSSPLGQLPQRAEQARDMDWSPDGNFLAFVGEGGNLYVAHVFDPVAKKPGEVKAVATVPSLPDVMVPTIRAPRWSPDGRMIAYIQTAANQPANVCVVDVASGKETVLADDGIDMAWIWEQPWSPDSKNIAYTGGEGSMSVNVVISNTPPSESNSNKGSRAFIAVVSIDGKKRTEIARGSCLCPSWSPKGDRIVYTSTAPFSVKLAEDKYIGGVTMSLWASDSKGGARKQLTGFNVMSKAVAAEFQDMYSKSAAREFEKDYASGLTPAQLKKLKSSKMNPTEMVEIARKIASKQLGIDPKKFGWPLDSTIDLSTEDPRVKEAYSKAIDFMTRSFREMVPLLTMRMGKMDLSPVWSPDGQKIAFVHGFPVEDYPNKLMMLDISTGKSKMLMEQAGIECLSWTQKGQRLVLQCRRLMSRSGEGLEVKSQPGYPEIWMLEPK